MKVIKVKCRGDDEKTHKLFMDAGIQGQFVLDLCDQCYSDAETCWLMEWNKLSDSAKKRIGP